MARQTCQREGGRRLRVSAAVNIIHASVYLEAAEHLELAAAGQGSRERVFLNFARGAFHPK